MKRLTIDFIKLEFTKRGYTLFSNNYINNRNKLDYKCANNHEHSITWHDFEVGKGCPNCSGVAKLDIDYVNKIFNNYGYTLLTKNYSNNKQKLKYECSNGHIGFIRWDVWQRGIRCSKCYGNDKIVIDFIKEELKKDNYTLISHNYDGNKSLLISECSLGHKYNFTWNSWQQGNRCSTCHNISRYGSSGSNWKGGVSYEPYCPIWSDKEYKKDIRERDNNKCLNPYCCSKNPNDLTIHHIDYNKKNCSPYNLVTVCRSCNGMANKDREWHTAWYNAIIYNRYTRSR